MAERGKWLRRALGALVLVYVGLTSVWFVAKDEEGVVTRFGRADRVVASGVNLTLPWPLERMQRVSTTEVRTIPVGFETDGTTDAQWLTGDTNIVEMKVVVQYVVADPVLYLFSVADYADGRSRDEFIEQAARAELTRAVARMRVDDVLSAGKARVQREIRVGIQAMLEELHLGLRLLTVNIAEARPPERVIEAFNDVASAESDKERMITEADGFRRDLLPRERSRANQLIQNALIYKDEVVSRARGSAARFRSLGAEVRARPEVSRHRLWLDTVSEVLTRGETIMYSTAPGQTFELRVVE